VVATPEAYGKIPRVSVKSVEFWFDFGSPTSYLAWTQLPALRS